MKPALLYANYHEVKYINYSPAIPLDRDDILRIWKKKDRINFAILFGCCGLLQSKYSKSSKRIPLKKFVVPLSWVNFDGREIGTSVPNGVKWTNELVGKYVGACGIGYTSDISIKYRYEVNRIIAEANALVVDQESYKVLKMCRELLVPAISIRYVIDKCDKRVMPPGINHFWRMFQHYRMQKKMEELLNEL